MVRWSSRLKAGTVAWVATVGMQMVYQWLRVLCYWVDWQQPDSTFTVLLLATVVANSACRSRVLGFSFVRTLE